MSAATAIMPEGAKLSREFETQNICRNSERVGAQSGLSAGSRPCSAQAPTKRMPTTSTSTSSNTVRATTTAFASERARELAEHPAHRISFPQPKKSPLPCEHFSFNSNKYPLL